MTLKQNTGAYTASFRHGARSCLAERADIISMLLIYTTLLVVFFNIFKILPVNELGRADITPLHLFWYFMVTEIVLVSVQGNEREFGRLIGDGQLATLMQRPGHMLGLWLARMYGTVLTNALILLVVAFGVIPCVLGSSMPMPLVHVPFFILSLLLAMLIFLLIGYCIGMIEIFGPYSRSFSWMINKTIFTFGGLFFPVVFFPHLLQLLVHVTPGPAILFIPGNFMLNPTTADLIRGFGEQLFWVVACAVFAIRMEKRLIANVMENGD